MRVPLGILAEHIGRKSAAILGMVLTSLALLYGWLFVSDYPEILMMGILLGIAGASFGVGLSLGSSSYPPEYKGLAMGIVGAGNSGTALAALFGPLLAQRYGWNAVYGLAVLPLLGALVFLSMFAQESPAQETKHWIDYFKILFEKDVWIFSLIYVVTFGGFIGLANFLPTFFYDEFGMSKIKAGQLAAGIVLMGGIVRMVGGYCADAIGGTRTLTHVFILIMVGLVLCAFFPSIYACTFVLLVIFAGLGIGNGAIFQLVPLRFSYSTTVASSLIGAIGALGGAFIPPVMGISKQATASFTGGFLSFGLLTLIAFTVFKMRQKHWVHDWMDADGKALRPREGRVQMFPVIPVMEIY